MRTNNGRAKAMTPKAPTANKALATLLAVAVGMFASCAEQAPPQGGADSYGAADVLASPPAPDAIASLDGSPEGSVDPELLATVEGAAGEPTIKITTPAAVSSYAKVGTTPVNVTATVTVTNFVLGTDGQIQWLLDGTPVAKSSGTSYQFLNIPNGVHYLSVQLLNTSNAAVGGATGSFSVRVEINNSCVTVADCTTGNLCFIAACNGPTGAKTCKYGPAPTGGSTLTCCTTDFNCTYPQKCAASTDPNPNKCVTCTTVADCADDNPCTSDPVCNSDGTCSYTKDPTCCTTNAECDDGLYCTPDSCNLTTNKCNTPVATPGCCDTVADCDNSNVCKLVACISHVCRTGPVPNCCTKNADCDDKNLCTVNTCIVATNKCDFSVKTSATCCITNTDCNDNLVTTDDTCVANNCVYTENETQECTQANVATACTKGKTACNTAYCTGEGICAYTPVANCCVKDADCKDALACTADTCNTSTNKCVFTPKPPPCCETSATCNDNNLCTLDACIANECRHGPDSTKPGCCTQNADCNDKNNCTVDTCQNDKCVFTADPTKPECCTSSVSCNDTNACTNDACVNNLCISTLKFAGCCTSDAQCNDNKACTVDICNLSTQKCDYPILLDACCTDADCAPVDKCHTGVCNTTTAQCSQVAIPGTECCSVAADCTAPTDPCQVAACTKGVCHPTAVAECCTNASQCDDQNLCTDNLCDTNTNKCDFPVKEGVDPNTCKQCAYHNQCNDNDKCTYDYCVSNKCVHLAIALCCQVDGEINGADCDDGNDCNIDKCTYSRCKHFPPGALGALIKPPAVCCAIDSDCPSDGNECTDEKCNGGECISTVKSGTCERPLPYKEPFVIQPGQDMAYLGFKVTELGTQPQVNHWGLAQVAGGTFGTAYMLRFNGGSGVQDQNLESCAVTPIVNTGTATKLQVGWKGWLNHVTSTAPIELRVQMAKDGNWGAAQTLWTKTGQTSIAGAPYQFEIATPSQFLGGKKVQMRFCVKTANTFGNWNWYIDDVFIVKGNAPVFQGNVFTQQVNVGATKIVSLKAKDADNDDLTFEIVSGPSFISLGTPYFYSGDGTWNTTLSATPANNPALAGYYPVTVRVNDGVLNADLTFTIVVKYEGGYLVWAPAGVTTGGADGIKAALLGLGKQAQIQQAVVYYPDLTKFKAVFVTLGAYPNTYTLSTGDANKLATYMNNGGRIYMEGGDTFYFDAQTAVHPLFKVTATHDGAAVESLKGFTVLDGNSWGYTTNPTINSSVDRLEAQPAGGTVNFLRNQGALSYATVVAHDKPGGGYRSLASSILFTGVQDGASTKLDLMAAYLDFFDNGLPGCFDDGQCGDGNDCTTDTCNLTTKECEYTNNTGSCDDGNACTTGDACTAGACQGTSATVCNDNNPCTTDFCDSTVGCQYTNNTASCSDGNACTIGDKCTSGTCTPTGAKNCADTNPCTEDTQCIPATGCVNAPKTGSCDDGNVCTIGDSCSNGSCVPGTGTKACSDSNDCTIDSCDPAVSGGCKYTNAASGASCSDSNACTTGDHCNGSGACVKTADANCNDGNACTNDTCVPASGCVNQNNAITCDDGNQCTINDKCAGGACGGTAKVCPDDGNVCTTESCDTTLGCKSANNTANCNDNDACTTSDKCTAGNCVGQAPKNCDDGNPCTADSCNTTTAACINTPILNGSCDDGNACTSGDKCNASGTCTAGTVVVTCNDSNPCTTDACNTTTGQCVFTNVAANTACNDNNGCTSGDKCNASGQCLGTAVDCGDSNPCTTDTCAAGVCVYTGNSGATCDDGNKCTLSDKCGGTDGKICGGTPNACNDSNVCTSDACNPAGAGDGCTHLNNTASCDDGNLCTTGDVCSAGTCQAGAPKNCDDGNVCTIDSCNTSNGQCQTANNAAYSETCYSGSPGNTENVGLCHGGLKTCVNKALTACAGEVIPVTEACDGEDNDCDGQTDEGCLPASMRFIIPSAIIKGDLANGNKIRGGLGQPLGGKAANGTGYQIHYGFYPTTVGP